MEVMAQLVIIELKGLSTIDIDNEEDFRLAETIMISRSSIDNIEKPMYYSDTK